VTGNVKYSSLFTYANNYGSAKLYSRCLGLDSSFVYKGSVSGFKCSVTSLSCAVLAILFYFWKLKSNKF